MYNTQMFRKLLRKIWFYLRYPKDLLPNIERWVAYRTYERYNVVKTNLPPGYYDPSTILLEVSFTVLKDYIETEAAYHAEWNHPEVKVPWWRRLENKIPHTFLNRIIFPNYRSPELGVLYIEDQIKWTSEDTYMPQNIKEEKVRDLQEILFLYKWWVNRDNRPEPGDSSGFYDYCDVLREQYGKSHSFKPASGGFEMVFNGNVDEEKKYTSLAHKMHEEEQRLQKEDEEMLIRLAKIRLYLWT